MYTRYIFRKQNHIPQSYTNTPTAVGTDVQQDINVQCNTEARSLNHCCNGKSRSITYTECL